MKLPTYDTLVVPLLRARRAAGGSGSIDEIYEKVVELEQIPEDGTVTPAAPGLLAQRQLESTHKRPDRYVYFKN